MVETEIIMKSSTLRLAAVSLLLAVFSFSASAQSGKHSWKAHDLDGSRTGVTCTANRQIADALGSFNGSTYVAPNGKKFCKNSATAAVAREVISVQPAMSRVREVIGYAPKPIYVGYPESPLSNLFIDVIMASVQKASGRKVDIGVGNFRGIRLGELSGNILLDDLLSMFPFKNQIVYVGHTGAYIRQLIETMASTKFQPLGGVEIEVVNGKVVKALIGGEPIDDDKIYGMATISFLLNGGDMLYLGQEAIDLQIYDIDIIDIMLDYVRSHTKAGEEITYSTDSRVIIK